MRYYFILFILTFAANFSVVAQDFNDFSWKEKTETKISFPNVQELFAAFFPEANDALNSLETSQSDKEIVKKDCSCNGIRLYGKVKVVESFADFDVQIVEAFPDIDVKIVTAFPDECGKWKFVESFPDFTIRFVTSFPDFKIRYVEAFPGMK